MTSAKGRLETGRSFVGSGRAQAARATTINIRRGFEQEERNRGNRKCNGTRMNTIKIRFSPPWLPHASIEGRSDTSDRLKLAKRSGRDKSTCSVK